ncbi:MAG: hypothetical protein AAFZ07_02060 [Actinomycetota bacterium]
MRWQTLPGVLLLCVAACSGSGTEDTTVRPLGDPEATSTTTAPTSTTAPPPTTAASTTTTTEPDPWAIPAAPDAAYFERVLNELEVSLADATRSALREGATTDDVLDTLTAISSGINLEYNVAGIRALTTVDEQVLTLERTPLITEVTIHRLDGSCSIVEGTVSFDGVYTAPRDPDRVVFELVRGDSRDLNPTGWLVSQRHAVDTTPPELCAGS